MLGCGVMNKQEIERLYQDTWRKYDLGLIGADVLRQQVEYCADRMESLDFMRARKMRESVQGY